MLILDLDNTIFETKTIRPEIFQPVMDLIENYYQSKNENQIVQQIIQKLWTSPMDEVFEKFNTPEKIKQQAYKKINELDYKLEITTYDDYEVLKSIPLKKILVTTGYEKLQFAKIKALNIKSDFIEIIIDDPLSSNRKYKLGIFKEILEKEKLKAEQVWVIGDSADNEIKAGKTLGMNTIQRVTTGVEKSTFADFGIISFHELNRVIKGI